MLSTTPFLLLLLLLVCAVCGGAAAAAMPTTVLNRPCPTTTHLVVLHQVFAYQSTCESSRTPYRDLHRPLAELLCCHRGWLSVSTAVRLPDARFADTCR
jgi:hypothetical protein